MLAALSPRDREVLLLRFFGRLKFGEIAQTLGIAEATAKVRAIRAIERLRRMVIARGLTASDLL